MSLLANSLSEEIELTRPSSPASSSSSPSPNTGRIKGKGKAKQVAEKNKIIAACTGAVLTSLTMTPFDVIKTRLQTQVPPEPLFAPSSQLPPPIRSTTPYPPPEASTSRSPPPSSTSLGGGKSASNLATCCHKTFFSSNGADKNLLCRFDPRLSTASLPASGSHLVSASRRSTTPSALVHNLASLRSVSPSSVLLSSSNGISMPIYSPLCTYPSSVEAILSLPSQSQPSSSRHLSGFWDAVTKIIRHEGLAAMWRGTGPALAMSVPGQIVYMVGYDFGRRTAFNHAPTWAYVPQRAEGFSLAPQLEDEERPLRPSYLVAIPVLAGSLSRTVVAALVSPVELLRTRLQSSTQGTDIPAIFKQLRADGGWRAAWKGLPATLWRDVPFSGIYWAGYEAIKRKLTGGKGMGEGWEGQGAWDEFAVAFVSGAGSGMIAATLTNPFDVVKTRRQGLINPPTFPQSLLNGKRVPPPPQLNKTFAIIFDIAKKEGWAGLFRGLTPRLAKVGPACGIMVGCYEGLGRYLD